MNPTPPSIPSHRLHPAMAQAVNDDAQARKEAGLEHLHLSDLKQLREFTSIRSLTPPHLIHQVEDRIIAGHKNDITLRIYRPSDQDNLPVLMWFHGGGWVIGDLDSADVTCRKIAQQSECIVISVDYHLAPESRFPTAMEDCYVATQWVVENSLTLNCDATRLAVGGDSAGGNLAACVALKALQEKLHLLFQLLIYPVIDANFQRSSYQEYADNVNLTQADMEWFWDCYQPDTTMRQDPLASPIHADNLSHLPPALIITAECDPLRDEGYAYSEALRSAGVHVHYQCFPGMIHGFFNRETEQPVEAIQSAFDLATTSLKANLYR